MPDQEVAETPEQTPEHIAALEAEVRVIDEQIEELRQRKREVAARRNAAVQEEVARRNQALIDALQINVTGVESQVQAGTPGGN